MAGSEALPLASEEAKSPDQRFGECLHAAGLLRTLASTDVYCVACTPALNADVRAALEKFDINHDDSFDIQELGRMNEVLGLGWTEEELRGVMHELGAQSMEGSVPVERFLVWWETSPLAKDKRADILKVGRADEHGQLY